MEIPDAVKKQAIDAISAPETQALLRAFKHDIRDVSPNALFTHREFPSPQPRPVSPEAKQAARDAVSSPEVQSWVRQIECDGEIRCPLTPRPGMAQIAGKVVQFYSAGHAPIAAHQQITRDHFGKEL